MFSRAWDSRLGEQVLASLLHDSWTMRCPRDKVTGDMEYTTWNTDLTISVE